MTSKTLAVCKMCKNTVEIKGYLYICNNSSCNFIYWNKSLFSLLAEGKKFYNLVYDEKKKKNKKVLTADYKKILDDANIKKPKFGENFIYQIKLKKGNQEAYLKKLIQKDEKNIKKSFYEYYVGKTTLHPLERYLRHIIGYQSGKKIAHKYQIALVYYEGPMNSDDATHREEELADQLRLNDYTVYQN